MREVRGFTKQHLAWNPAVSDAQRELLGITVYSSVRTSIPPPQTRPEFNYKVLDIMRILIDFKNQGIASRAIPYGYSGAMFFYATADAPITDYDLLVKTALMTHSPWTLELPPESQGKMLSGAMVWQNRRGRWDLGVKSSPSSFHRFAGRGKSSRLRVTRCQISVLETENLELIWRLQRLRADRFRKGVLI